MRRTHPTAVSGGDDIRVPTSYRWCVERTLRLRLPGTPDPAEAGTPIQ
ncbi:MAG: hypothetical protein ACLFVO_13345 [Chloroflexaceae bacterium]